MDETNLQLEDHLQKCRCCFRMLIDDDKTVKITETIEQKFLSLTGVALIQDPEYSDVVCELCSRDLNRFYYLKKDLSRKQLLLYEFHPIRQQEDPMIIIEALDEVVMEPACEEKKEPVLDEKSDSVFIVREMKVEPPPARIRRPRKQTIESPAKQSEDPHNGKFVCTHCAVSVSSSTSLKRHIDRVHLKVRDYSCDFCSYSAFFKHSLEKHIVRHIPEEFRTRFSCVHCDFISISAVNIQLHNKFEHGEVKMTFICHYQSCKKEFARPGQLTAHVKLTHEKRREKICSHCNKAFSTTTRLKEHVMSTHSTTNARDFSCEFCAKQFLTMRQLKNHQVYHEIPKFQCQLGCGKVFYKSILLDGHHKTHLEQKDFICPFEKCSRKYFLKSHLHRHIQSFHEKIKINCELCPASFVRKETYRSHVLAHHQNLTETETAALLKRIRVMKLLVKA